MKERMQSSLKNFLLLICIALISCGCRPTMSDHLQTTQSGINSLPWPRQMETLFGEGDHFITHFGFDSKPKLWNTEVFFGGRYTLTMQVEVEINYRKNKIEKIVSPPKFYLKELGSTTRDSANRVDGADISQNWVFDEVKWKNLVKAKGDWTAIGITVSTNDPIAGFEDYVKRLRSPRDKIPH